MVPRHERRVWFYYLLSSHDHIELGHRVTFYLLKKEKRITSFFLCCIQILGWKFSRVSNSCSIAIHNQIESYVSFFPLFLR
jgi:hypothetical protein